MQVRETHDKTHVHARQEYTHFAHSTASTRCTSIKQLGTLTCSAYAQECIALLIHTLHAATRTQHTLTASTQHVYHAQTCGTVRKSYPNCPRKWSTLSYSNFVNARGRKGENFREILLKKTFYENEYINEYINEK
jgi:hypothetical protein